MEERELETIIRPIQDKDIIVDDQPHGVTFADFVEKLLEEKYSPEEKEYLNKIFLAREETLKSGREYSQSGSRAILSILATDYEQFIFDTIKRRMEEQHACKNTTQQYLVK